MTPPPPSGHNPQREDNSPSSPDTLVPSSFVAGGRPDLPAGSHDNTPPRGAGWSFLGHVEYVTGAEADHIRTEMAHAVRDLLAWAATDLPDRPSLEHGRQHGGEEAA